MGRFQCAYAECFFFNLFFSFIAEAHLQRGEDYLVHGGKVGVPQHLGPLSEGQDPLIPHRSHCGRHLRATEARRGEKKEL